MQNIGGVGAVAMQTFIPIPKSRVDSQSEAAPSHVHGYRVRVNSCLFLLQSQGSTEGMLVQSTVPRRQSVSSHGSPLPPSSPILEETSADHYKICSSYRVGPPSINTVGMNCAFNSFPHAPHQPTSLHMPGVGYPHNPQSAGMCHTPAIYTTQDSMCPSGTSPLGLPMWK